MAAETVFLQFQLTADPSFRTDAPIGELDELLGLDGCGNGRIVSVDAFREPLDGCDARRLRTGGKEQDSQCTKDSFHRNVYFNGYGCFPQI